MEKLAKDGKENIENLIIVYFTLKKDFPGIALMVFRSITAAFSYNSFDIDILINDLDKLEDDLSLDTYDILCDYFYEDDDISEDTEIITKIKKELNNATKESSR